MGYLPQELIRKKRDGLALTRDEIGFLIQGVTSGRLADEQVGAFAMAVFLRGMDMDERVALTCAMRDSGQVLRWDNLHRPVVDKHSTGGVGDKVSLLLAPLVAACGAAVPMISGRGLGHTGGTLDKLDSIPGYNATPSPGLFHQVVGDIGCAIIGQTADMAPADKRLYAIRDVTATVESIPLITASILSKKLAAGLGALVMDVKFGSGAFMPTLDLSRELADSIVTVAQGAGLPTRACLTDMNQVLGRSAGNAVEVRETIDHLTGLAADPRLLDVTLALGAEMLVLTGLAEDLSAAHAKLRAALDSGLAAEIFARMVASLGGPGDLLEHPERHLPPAPVEAPIYPERAGYVSALDVRGIGLTVLELGGGRQRASDRIDPAVGLTGIAGLGEAVGPDAPLALCWARSSSDWDRAANRLRRAITISDTPLAAGPAVLETR